MCGLRRGEIAAVQYEDIVGDLLHIHADMVQDSKNKWIYKEIPKTDGSDRFIRLPSAVLDLIGSGSGYIVRGLNPNSIGQAFGRLAHQLGYNIHLHQLRHYYASVGAILGVPDIYLADMGGWKHDSGVMKSVYQNKIKSMSDYYADKMNDHIDGIMQKKGEAK
jgi:integrase